MVKFDRPHAVLYCHWGDDWLRGSETALLTLLDHLDQNRFNPIVWTNCGPLASETQARSIPTILNEFQIYFQWSSPQFNPKEYWLKARRACQILSNHRISIVHANSAAPCQWLVPACLFMRRPIISALHAIYLRRDRIVLGAHFATRIVGVSNAVVAPFLRDGVNPGIISVIENAVDCQRLRKTSLLNRPEILSTGFKGVTIVAIGALVYTKGFDILIEAAKQLGETALPFRVLIIGDGDERPCLEALAGSAPIHFLGWRKDAHAIAAEYADILVLPSRQESFGLVCLEAACFGIPSVAAKVGGIPEHVIDGKTGLLFPPEDAAALAQMLNQIITDAELRRRLGEEARNQALSKFAPARFVERFELLYESLLAQPQKIPFAPISRVAACLRAKVP